jgi:hypothetical protein
MSQYKINVSQRYKQRQRTPYHSEFGYSFYFRIRTDLLPMKEDGGYPTFEESLDKLVIEMRHLYPSPEYKVDVTKYITTTEEVEI